MDPLDLLVYSKGRDQVFHPHVRGPGFFFDGSTYSSKGPIYFYVMLSTMYIKPF